MGIMRLQIECLSPLIIQSPNYCTYYLQTLQSGLWKTASIDPVHKKIPVSVEVFEWLSFNVIFEFFKKNELSFPHHSVQHLK